MKAKNYFPFFAGLGGAYSSPLPAPSPQPPLEILILDYGKSIREIMLFKTDVCFTYNSFRRASRV